MYENYKLCPDLEPRECCLVLEQYHEGNFTRKYHRHFPRHRVSQSAMIEMIKAFVVRFDGWSGFGPDLIVDSYLNSRGRNPGDLGAFQIRVTYPEPGVIRRYCGTDTKAWIDEVISPNKFRQVPVKA
ncbi:MAG: hypothetical protein WCA56_02415 [Xanthobacteraceae bacterium]